MKRKPMRHVRPVAVRSPSTWLWFTLLVGRGGLRQWFSGVNHACGAAGGRHGCLVMPVQLRAIPAFFES